MDRFLGYIEIPVAYNCNLGCRGCSHFSNVAGNSEYLGPDQLQKDMRRLRELVPYIYMIRLLGGEPFLNPEIDRLAETVRAEYPDTKIFIVSNGLMIPKTDKNQLKALAGHNVKIEISAYPPTMENKAGIEEILNECGLDYSFTEPIRTFRRRMARNGDHDPAAEFEKCQIGKDCHYLDRGYLSVCPAPQVARIIYKKYGFNADPEDSDVLNIYDPNLSFEDIRRFLQKAPSVCRFCTTPETFEWTNFGKPELEDWFASEKEQSGKEE